MTRAGSPPSGISSIDLGQRVVVRSRLPGRTGPTGGQAYTDVLGILEHRDERSVRIRRSDGTVVEIATADVARIKQIPPPPRMNAPQRP